MRDAVVVKPAEDIKPRWTVEGIKRYWQTLDPPARTAHTEPGRRAAFLRFERMADPDGLLESEERTRRGRELLWAHLRRIAIKRERAKRERQEVQQAEKTAKEAQGEAA